MPSKVTKGLDGIVVLKNPADNTVIGQLPCLKSYTLDVSPSFQTTTRRCMKSNGDGGSDANVGFDSKTLTGKTFTLSLEFYWQEDDDVSVAAAAAVDVVNVGNDILFELYPNDNTSGQPLYSGSSKIGNSSISGQVDTDIDSSVTLEGDEGGLTRANVV